MIEHSEVVRYLLDQNLLAASTVVDGTVVVRDASSRNRLFIVDAGDASSWVMKQGTGPEGAVSVAHEASMYQLLGQCSDRVTRFLPSAWQYDQSAKILIVGKDYGARDLRSHLGRTGRMSSSLACALGDALGSLHQETEGSAPASIQRSAPWILTVHRPGLSVFRDASSAALELIRLIQSNPETGSRLDELGRKWQSSCLIHFDVKWDNLLAYPRNGRARSRFGLKLIDWEAARIGDPRWDLGSVFSHFLSVWLLSIPITGRDPPERFPELARFPLNRMQPAMAACWSAYRKHARLEACKSAPWLLTAASYAAARLIQTAFEAAQSATQLDSSMVLHLQLASNILSRPREAVAHLLGLPIGSSR